MSEVKTINVKGQYVVIEKKEIERGESYSVHFANERGGVGARRIEVINYDLDGLVEVNWYGENGSLEDFRSFQVLVDQAEELVRSF